MSAKSEVCWRKEITVSQQKVGGVPKNGEKSVLGSDCREKGKAADAGNSKPGTVNEDVSDSQS